MDWSDVWVRAYCAALSAYHYRKSETAAQMADEALAEYKFREKRGDFEQ